MGNYIVGSYFELNNLAHSGFSFSSSVPKQGVGIICNGNCTLITHFSFFPVSKDQIFIYTDTRWLFPYNEYS